MKFEWEIKRYEHFMNDFNNFQHAYHLWHGTHQVHSPGPIALYSKFSSLNLLCHVQICIAVGAFLTESLKDACSTVLFDCIQVYAKHTKTFSFLVDSVSVFEKKKNIKHWLVLMHAVKIWVHLNKNLSSY